MSSTPTANALLCQLEATLQLVMALAPSLTITELAGVHQTLARSYDSIGVVLEGRLLNTGVSFACEFCTCLLNTLLTPFQHR